MSAHATPTTPAIAMAVGPPSLSARIPPANAATAAAAARPIPRNPTTRPRIRAGYDAPHNRSWNGELNDMLSQKIIAMRMTTLGWVVSGSAIRTPAPNPRRSANWGWSRAPASGEDAQEVGEERRGGEDREADRLETAPAGDRREQRADQGTRDPDTDGRDEIETEVPPERPQPFDGIARRASHGYLEPAQGPAR